MPNPILEGGVTDPEGNFTHFGDLTIADGFTLQQLVTSDGSTRLKLAIYAPQDKWRTTHNLSVNEIAYLVDAGIRSYALCTRVKQQESGQWTWTEKANQDALAQREYFDRVSAHFKESVAHYAGKDLTALNSRAIDTDSSVKIAEIDLVEDASGQTFATATGDRRRLSGGQSVPSDAALALYCDLNDYDWLAEVNSQEAIIIDALSSLPEGHAKFEAALKGKNVNPLTVSDYNAAMSSGLGVNPRLANWCAEPATKAVAKNRQKGGEAWVEA